MYIAVDIPLKRINNHVLLVHFIFFTQFSVRNPIDSFILQYLIKVIVHEIQNYNTPMLLAMYKQNYINVPFLV